MQPGQPAAAGRAGAKDSTGQIGKVPGAARSTAPTPGPVPLRQGGQPLRPQPGQPVRPPSGGRPSAQGARAPMPPAQPNHGKTGARPAAGKRPVGKVKQTAKQAHLRITKLDLLAVLKMSFLFGFSISLILFVGGFALWHLLLLSGAIDSAQNLINSVLGNPAAGGAANLQLGQYLNNTRVIGFFAGIAVVNVFILTLLGTVFGALYNLASTLFGGVEVTLEV